MTPLERRAALALTGCRFIPGVPAKRFARSLAHAARVDPGAELTGPQRHYLWALVWRMRRQLPDDLVQVARQRTARPDQADVPAVVARQLNLFNAPTRPQP